MGADVCMYGMCAWWSPWLVLLTCLRCTHSLALQQQPVDLCDNFMRCEGKKVIHMHVGVIWSLKTIYMSMHACICNHVHQGPQLPETGQANCLSQGLHQQQAICTLIWSINHPPFLSALWKSEKKHFTTDRPHRNLARIQQGWYKCAPTKGGHVLIANLSWLKPVTTTLIWKYRQSCSYNVRSV